MEKKIVSDTFQSFLFPTLASSVTLSVLSMTDLVIAGQLVGEHALTAISLSLPLTIFVLIMTAMFGTGGAVVLSARLGEGNRDACNQIFTAMLSVSFCLGIVFSVLGLFFLDPLIHLSGGTSPETISLAADYMGILLAGLPFSILSPVIMTCLRNDNEQKYTMICVISSSIFNIIFSLFFAASRFGVGGIALATVMAQILSCFLGSLRLFRKRRMFHLVRCRITFSLLLSIVRPGLPVAAIFCSQTILTIIINRELANAGGSQAVAVYAILKYLINFMYALFDGVTGAAQPMLGIYYGEREKSNLLYTVRCMAAGMLAASLLMMLTMEFLTAPICSLFGIENHLLRELAQTAMRIQGVACISSGTIAGLNAFYRCTGNEKISFFLSIADNFLCPVLAIILCLKIGNMGVNGIWWGLTGSSLFVCLGWLLICRFRGRGILFLCEERFLRPENEFHIICSATSQQLPSLLAEVESYCRKLQISFKKQYYISLIIEELVVNVIHLAQDGKTLSKQKSYYVDLRITPKENQRILLRIRDNLTDFNPQDYALEDICSLAQDSDSGPINVLGIGLVMKISPDCSYKRTIGFNNFSVILP